VQLSGGERLIIHDDVCLATRWTFEYETCSERERLLSKWSESSRRVARLADEQLAAIKNADPCLAGLDEKIRLAKTEPAAPTTSMSFGCG
jgi:hypothetical protein